MLLKEIVGKPIVGIEEGKSLATVKKLLINRKNRILEYMLLNLRSVRDKEVTFVVPFEDLEGIGDYAVMVRSREMIQRLDEEDVYSSFYKELTELIGELVISERGNRLGKVTDLLIDEKQGKVLEIGVTDETTAAQFNFSEEDILVFGYDVVIVNDTRAASIVVPRAVTKEMQSPKSGKKVPEAMSPVSSKQGLEKLEDGRAQVSCEKEEIKGASREEEAKKSDEFKNEQEKEAVRMSSERFFKDDEDISEFETTSTDESISEIEEGTLGNVEEETYLLDDQEVRFADQELIDAKDTLFMEEDFLELNHSKGCREDIVEDVPQQTFKDKSEKEKGIFERKEEVLKGFGSEKKDNISSFDEYKKSLVKQFIDRQREVLVGKRVTENILGKDGNILIEKGNVITMDLFNRANDDRKDSIVEMAMYSE